MLNWKTSREDQLIIAKIADRAEKLFKGLDIERERVEIIMDVEATHNNGCPLRLKELVEADDFNFSHDIIGIYNTLNRTTGKIEGIFWPRYAVKQ